MSVYDYLFRGIPFDERLYLQDGGGVPPIIPGEKLLDEVLILEPFERRLEKFRVSNNIPTFDEYYSERNKKAQQNRDGVSKEQVRTEYDRMLNTRYANRLMQEFPQQKNEHRGKYLDRLEKLGNGLSEYIGQWGVPLSRYDRIAQGVTGLADVVTGGAFNLYEKDNQTNFRLSEREKEEKRQALKKNPWTERLSDGLSTLEIGSAPVEAVSSFIDPNVSFGQALAGQDTDVNGALKGLIGVGLGAGAKQGARGLYKAGNEVKYFTDTLGDEIRFVRKVKKEPEYFNKLLENANVAFNRKLSEEAMVNNGIQSTKSLPRQIGNFIRNYKYKRFYNNPENQMKLKSVNKELKDYFENPEYLKYLDDAVVETNIKMDYYSGWESELHRLERLKNRIGDGKYKVSLLTPETQRELRLFSDSIYKTDLLGGKSYHNQAGNLGVSYQHSDYVFDPRVDVNKQNFVSPTLFKDKKSLSSTAVHEGEHGINSIDDAVQTLNYDFQEGVGGIRTKRYNLDFYNNYANDNWDEYITRANEVTARIAEIKMFNGLKPHEHLAEKHIQNYINHHKYSSVESMMDYFTIDEIIELSKKQYYPH